MSTRKIPKDKLVDIILAYGEQLGFILQYRNVDKGFFRFRHKSAPVADLKYACVIYIGWESKDILRTFADYLIKQGEYNIKIQLNNLIKL